MARNRILSAKTVGDIDARVERVLRGLGHPEPPLRLEDVRELLKLDRMFYTVDDPTMIREMTSRIRIAGIQVFERPMLIIDAIRKSLAQGALSSGPQADSSGCGAARTEASLERNARNLPQPSSLAPRSHAW